MSFNLHWYKPPAARTQLGSGSTELKHILAARYSERDGSCKASFVMTDQADADFVRGLVAGGVEDAKDLLQDLIKHGSLELEIE